MLKKYHFSSVKMVYLFMKFGSITPRSNNRAVLFRDIKKISLTLTYLLSHFLKLQNQKYILLGYVVGFAFQMCTLNIQLLSRRMEHEAVISNCHWNVFVKGG